MKNVLLLSAVSCALLVSSFSAAAQSLNLTQPSYTHFSLGIGETSRGYRSFRLDTEYEFGHKLYATGHYQHVRQRFDDNTRFRESVLDIGLGRYFTVYDRTTLDFSASVGNYTRSSNVFSTSGQSFYTLNTGLRRRHDMFEYQAGYRYIDMEQVNSRHGVVASAHVYFSPQSAFGVYFNNVYSSSNWSLGMRFLF